VKYFDLPQGSPPQNSYEWAGYVLAGKKYPLQCECTPTGKESYQKLQKE